MDNNAKKQDSMYCTYTVCTVYCTYSLEPDSAFANPALGALGLNFYKEHFCSKIGDSNFINTMLHIVKFETKLAVLNFESVLYAE